MRFRGAREKGAKAFLEYLGFSQEDTMEGPLWRETIGRSLGSHDATELVGGMCHGNGCRQETSRVFGKHQQQKRLWGPGRSGNGSGGVGERRSAGRKRGRGRSPVDKHRLGTGTGTGTGTEATTVAEMGTGTRITGTGTGTRIESGRAKARRKSARNSKIVVDVNASGIE